MSDAQEPTGSSGTESPSAASPPPAKSAPAKPAPRALPTEEDVARFIAGEDVPVIRALFDQRTVKTFDALIMQIRKDELLPQHWQVITAVEAPPDDEFDQLPEVGRLRAEYKDQELARRRLDAMRVAWRELRGKKPALWTVPDLFAAMRRIYDRKLEVDFHELLAAARDLWRTSTLPAAELQLEILWSCLDFTRQKTRK